METATELAVATADPFLQSGTLGATVVALATALVLVVILGWRIIDKKDKRIAEIEKGWRDDLRTSLVSVTTAVATLEKAETFVMERGRR
jgi:hypothetical protein